MCECVNVCEWVYFFVQWRSVYWCIKITHFFMNDWIWNMNERNRCDWHLHRRYLLYYSEEGVCNGVCTYLRTCNSSISNIYNFISIRFDNINRIRIVCDAMVMMNADNRERWVDRIFFCLLDFHVCVCVSTRSWVCVICDIVR